jgi:hypothetical protein
MKKRKPRSIRIAMAMMSAMRKAKFAVDPNQDKSFMLQM